MTLLRKQPELMMKPPASSVGTIPGQTSGRVLRRLIQRRLFLLRSLTFFSRGCKLDTTPVRLIILYLTNKEEFQGAEEQQYHGEKWDFFDATQFSDFLNVPQDYMISNGCCYINKSFQVPALTTSFEWSLTEKGDSDSGGRELEVENCSFSDAAQSSLQEGPDMEALDFRFLDDIGPSSYYSHFDMAEEMEDPVERRWRLSRTSLPC